MQSAARRLSAAAAASLGLPGVGSPSWAAAPSLAAANPLLTAIGRAAGLHTTTTSSPSSSTDIRAVMAEKIPVQQVRRRERCGVDDGGMSVGRGPGESS